MTTSTGASPLRARSGCEAHAVQFYDSDAYLAERISTFVADGLVAHEPVIVIATEPHRDALRARLKARSIDVEHACATGELTLLDASATLATFMVGDTPSWPLFEARISAVIEQSKRGREGRPLRAYGEMVDLLVRSGNPDGAIRLEEMWNELGKRHSFSLLCAYVMQTFDDADQSAVFERICSAHTAVAPTEQYVDSADEEQRLRQIGRLQQRARALETEVARRAALEKSLREKHAELDDFLENAAEGIHSVGPDGTILWANRAELELLGYGREEYIGRHIGEFHADRDRIADILGRLSRNETLRNYEATLRCKDGTSKEVLIDSNALFRDGALVHTRCFTRDITQRKRAEDQLRSAHDDLEKAGRMKDEFLITLSHELRTPLNAILGWVRMLQSGKLSPEKHARGLETIERNARAQATLVEDLLDVSRIVSGRLRLDVSRVDLVAIMESAADVVRPAAAAKGITLRQLTDSNPGPILGDTDRLQQVVWNVLTNAVKFTPTGGAVTSVLRKHGDHVEIVVTDTGVGMPPHLVDHVFDRFRQADSTTTRRHGGLGLGLAIVRHLVELHGGTVKAESEGIGKGSTFTICLPISVVEADAPAGPAPLSGVRASELPLARVLERLRILVLDDEPDSRELLSTVLSECKAVVSAAATVEEGISMVQDLRPDLIVSDIGMPGEDGYAFVQRLRALSVERGGRTPAVAVTAFARSEDRTLALASGYNMYLPKPIDPIELITVVASLAGVSVSR